MCRELFWVPGSRAHITTGANARMCASTHVLMHAKPREAITSLLSGLGLHGALHLGGGGKRGEQRQGSPSTPQQLLHYTGIPSGLEGEH